MRTLRYGRLGLQAAGGWNQAAIVAQVRTQNSHLRYVPTRFVSTNSAGSKSSGPVSKDWEIRMLYDGDCPLCMREVNMLQRRDKDVGKIDFVDISTPEYKPSDNANISYEEAMGEIHAVLPDGKVVKNVEVFRRLYEAVGLGWIYSITKVEPIGKAADWVYGIWAKYRMQVTGRPDFATVFAEKKACKIQSNGSQ